MLSILMLRVMKLRNDLLLILFMTAMVLGLTFVFGMTTKNYKPTVLVVNQDKSQYSEMFLDELKKKGTFNYELAQYEDAIKKVDEGNVLASVVIKENFGGDIDSNKKPTIGIIKATDDVQIITLENMLSSVSSKMIGNIKTARLTTDYVSKFNNDVNKEKLFEITYDKAVEYWRYRKPMEVTKGLITTNKWSQYDNLKHSVIGFTLFFSMYTIVFGIGEIVNERKNKTWQRQLVSPISKSSILGGNMIVTFLVGLIQVGILIIAGKYLFNIDWGNNMAGILTIAGSFVFTVTCLGLFLSGIVKTHSQLSAITPVILTSTSMLGGCMWPLEIINSKVLLLLANITPQKWAIQGMERIAMYGSGFEAAVIPSLVLLAMGLVYFGLGVRLVKFK